MGKTIDSIPLVSQGKSFVQWVSGDSEGARKTQENFLHTAPGVSQITSLVQLLSGDVEGARKTQEMFLENQIARTKALLTPVTVMMGEARERRAISDRLTSRPRWMGNVGVQGLCLHEILIPGTHDSATYKFKTDVPVMGSYAQAQKLDIAQQLDGGIRYLDIRVNLEDGKLFCSHTLATVPFDDALGAVKAFIESNPTEKVILNLDWDTRDRQDLVDAKAQAERFFGDRCVKPESLANPLATWGRQSVVLLERGKLADLDVVVNSWSAGTNAPTPDEAVAKCVTWARDQTRTPRKLNLAACQATPSGSLGTISETLLNADLGLEPLAARANFLIGSQLLVDKKAVCGVNVVNMDFADDGLIGAIIQLNPSALTEAGFACVEEGQSREFNEPYWVAYGAGDALAYALVDKATITFSTASFPDPIPGTAKKGYFKKAVAR